MADKPEVLAEVEERIQQKQKEFQRAVEEHPGFGFGIDPGNDPIAREAMTRLMEKNVIEQVLASDSGYALDPDALETIRAECREQVRALFARNNTT
jgi:hypothetical protein